MAIEGSWQVTKGVFERLRSRGVEDAIKATYWSNQITDPAKNRAVWKDQAPAGVQTPYVIFSVLSDRVVGHSAGTGRVLSLNGSDIGVADQGVQYRQALIRFLCYVAIKPGKDESVAVRVAGLIIDAIEDGKLSFSEGTRFITMTRQEDIQARDDDDSAVVGVQWLVDYEILTNASRQLA